MNPAEPTTILLIRHAESVWNTDGEQLCGSTDVPLTEQGLRDTATLAQALSARPLAAVYATPLDRSLVTARALAAPHRLDPEIVDDLRELDYGQWEGLSYAAVAEQFPEPYAAWTADPTDVSPPGGDSPRTVADRAWRALGSLVDRHPGQTIAVVAHKTVNRLILCTVLQIPIGRFRTALTQDNLALNEIRFNDGTPKVIHMNDLCHLPHRTGGTDR